MNKKTRKNWAARFLEAFRKRPPRPRYQLQVTQGAGGKWGFTIRAAHPVTMWDGYPLLEDGEIACVSTVQRYDSQAKAVAIARQVMEHRWRQL